MSAAFSPNGRFIVTAGRDRKAKIWETPTGPGTSFDPVAILAHEGVVTDGEFSRDGDLVVTAGFDGTVRVWQWKTYREGRVRVSPRRIEVGTILWA